MKRKPCLPSDLHQQIDETIRQLDAEAKALLASSLDIDSPAQLHDVEQQLAALARRAQDGLTGALIEHRLADPVFQARTTSAARQTGQFRSSGRRSFRLTLLGGSELRVKTEYIQPKRAGNSKQSSKKRGRGPGGAGMYPALVALGLSLGITPALSSELCHQISSSDSLEAGCYALKRRGIDLGTKPTWRLFNQVSKRARQRQRAWLKRARNGATPNTPGPLANKRVAVAVDGARVRVRVPRRGRRKDNGHHGFDAQWREPKMLVIQVLDDDGKVVDSFRPVYDGTLGDCDEVFDMLIAYLRALGADQARELFVLGDGARWIWDRADGLAAAIGIAPEQVTQVVDWYHAAQVLHEVANSHTSWSDKRRKRWVRKVEKRLYAGDTDAVAAKIRELAEDKPAKELEKHAAYFERNSARMQYAAFEAAKIPRGSGVVESMIRRVVNLRMKGNAKYWLEENAEHMLLIRSYVKAGRLGELLAWSEADAARWWAPAVAAAPSSPLGMGA